MSLVPSLHEVHYPDSDGEPMGETEVHINCLIRHRDILKRRFRGKQVYVGANMYLYYAEGEPQKNVAPDLFVVKDCDPSVRSVFKTWEDDRVPNAVIEITSESTRHADEIQKKELYEQLGVEEYLLFDPQYKYLNPPLQGFRLVNNQYLPIPPDSDGGIHCQSLGVIFRIDDEELALLDAATGKELLTDAEAVLADLKITESKLENAVAERDAERAARMAAEEELRRLREAMKLDPRNDNDD